MTSGYVLGVRGCQHLGYQATGTRLNRATRWNQRVVDGHVAHRLTMDSMLAAQVDGLVDGGDLTHWASPRPRDVELAHRVDDLRARAGVWAVGNSGNHCAGGGSDISAMSLMHRPDLGIQTVYPEPGKRDGIGPFPGLYEIHTAESNPSLPDGLALHLVSHYGLSRSLADAGVNIDPQPIDGLVNLFFSHGTFETDERLYRCIDTHGEERPIPENWATRGWDAVLLSHYHTMGPVPGYGDGDRGQVWYTGSSVRRGFSDEPGARGWLKVTIHNTGHVDIAPVPIWQRPQHDLTGIDATDLTVADLDDRVCANLKATRMADDESTTLAGDGGAIVRQTITHATPAQRQGLAALHGRFASLTGEAVSWTLNFRHPQSTMPTASAEGRLQREMTARVTDFGKEMRNRADDLAERVGVPAAIQEPATAQASEWADEVAVNVDRPEGDRRGQPEEPQ